MITQESLLDALQAIQEQMVKEVSHMEDRIHNLRTRCTALSAIIRQAKQSEYEDDLELLISYGKDQETRGVFRPDDFVCEVDLDKGYRLREAVTAALHNYSGNDALPAQIRDLHLGGVELQIDDLAVAANALYRLHKMGVQNNDTTGTQSTRKVPGVRKAGNH